MPLSPRDLRDLRLAREKLEQNYETASRIADLSSGSTRRLATELAADTRRAILEADCTLETDRRQRAENDARAEADRLFRGRGEGRWVDDRGEARVVPSGPRKNVEVEARRPDPVDPGLTEYHIKRGGRDMSEFGGEPLDWMSRHMHPARRCQLTNVRDPEMTGKFSTWQTDAQGRKWTDPR